MTAFLAGLAVGVALVVYTHVCWWRAWHRWADQHRYRQLRHEAIRVELLWRQKESAERLARREARRLRIARWHIGDLTMQLAAARPRRSIIPAYGINQEVLA